MPTIKEVDGGVMAVIKRRSIDEILAIHSQSIAERGKANDGSLSGVCRENVGRMSGVELPKRHTEICRLIKDNPYITAPVLAKLLSVSSRTIERDLSVLQKSGIIRHEGNTSAGVWVILEQKDKAIANINNESLVSTKKSST